MEKFANVEMRLNKGVKKGDQESLNSLFSFEDRIRRMEILADMEEGEKVKVVLEGLAETSLKLGNDMEKGDKKTIMTLFWFPEKSQLFEMKRNAQAGESIAINMWAITE